MNDARIELDSPEEIIGEFPVTTTQERCWFLDKVQPGNPALNVAIRWELRGKVSAENLEHAFLTVIERHEVLRTRFVERDGAPMQQVVAHVPFRLGELDLRTQPATDRMARIDAIAHEEAARPFDLRQPGLIRATLVRFEADRAILLIVAHQSCFDGFSIGVLGREIGTATQAFEEGRVPDLPDLPLQYGDFALWQKEYHDSGVLEEEGAYWQQTLQDAPYFEIPTDKPRPAQQNPDVQMMHLPLPDGFHDRLEQRARDEGVTAFTFGTAVISACLHRMTGASEVLMGTQIAGRMDVDLEPLIGVFINNLVLRFNTDPDTRLSDQIGLARDVVQGALAHQNMPFNRLVERLNPVRNASRNPIISINFNLMHVFLQGKHYGGFELISVPSHSPGSVYDLQFVIIGRPSAGWQLTVEYQTDLFEAATVERIMTFVRDGFEMALARPDMRLADIPLDPILEARRDNDGAGLKRVEETLKAHPMVDEVAAVHANEGSYAFVSPANTGTRPLERLPEELMTFAAGRLSSDEMPLGVSVLAGFPRTSRGDINRSLLTVPRHVGRAQAAVAGKPTEVDPAVESRLRTHWLDILSVTDVPAGATFFELGGHSLLVVRLLARIREDWGLELGIASVYEHATLPDLAALMSERIDRARPPEDEDWRILRLHREGDGPPLIAINNAATILAVQPELANPGPSICVRLFDGNRGIDQSPRSFEQIASEYAKVIRKAQPEGPYLLFGICVHGNIALEAARILQAEGQEVRGVVMKDVWEPGFVDWTRTDVGARRQNKLHSLRNRIRMVRDGTLSLSALLGSYRAVRATGILQAARAMGLIDRVRWSDLEEEQERFIKYISAARDVYRPGPLDIPVLHVVTRITPQGGAFPDSIGWEEIVTGPLKTVRLDEVLVHGSHRIGVERLGAEIESFLQENDQRAQSTSSDTPR